MKYLKTYEDRYTELMEDLRHKRDLLVEEIWYLYNTHKNKDGNLTIDNLSFFTVPPVFVSSVPWIKDEGVFVKIVVKGAVPKSYRF